MSVRALTALAILAVTTVLTLPGSAVPQSLPIRSVDAVDKTAVKKSEQRSLREQKQLSSLARTVSHLQLTTWTCQDKLGITRTRASASPWALPQSTRYRRWVAAHWSSQKASCASALSKRTIPITNDWVTATSLADRIFPGTKAWLLSCSSGEGGWGRFVMNGRGSGASGWLQYMPSTYYAHNDTAFAAARAKGFIIDERTNSLTHPFGQALTGAYMRTHGGSSNWDPAIDRNCR